MRDSKLAAKIVSILFPGRAMDIVQRITPDDARKQGMTVDSNCYPWLAYKGTRLAPSEAQACLTDTEATLLDHIFEVFDVEDNEKMADLLNQVEQFAFDLRTAEPQRSITLFRLLLLVERLFHANEILDQANAHLEDTITLLEEKNGGAAVH